MAGVGEGNTTGFVAKIWSAVQQERGMWAHHLQRANNPEHHDRVRRDIPWSLCPITCDINRILEEDRAVGLLLFNFHHRIVNSTACLMDELHSSSMSRSPIVIIGAGVGGLTLGRCLQRHKIPFKIYERADKSPRHNYGISLKRRTYRPLLEVLQTSDHHFRHALGVVKAHRTREPAAERTPDERIRIPLSDATQSSNSDFRANRFAFEAFLSEPIRQHIQYSSRFKSIRPATTSDAQVGITLEDGSAFFDLVIDCSGVHSPLRAALLPQYQPVVHPYVAINGKRYLRPGEWEDKYEPAFAEKTALCTNIQFEHEYKGATRSITARLEISINEIVLDHADRLERVSISYTYSRQAFSDDDPLYLPKRSKQAATEIPPQFFKEITSLTKSGKLSPAYMEAFDPAGAGHDRLLNWLLRSVHLEDSDVKVLRDQGVLVIGDAAYAEPIVGSLPGGANHVIGQAMRLADRLAVEWKSGKNVSEMDLVGYLEPKPESREEDVAAHLETLHELEPAKAAL